MLNRFIHKPSLYDIKQQENGKLSLGRFGDLPDFSVYKSLCSSALFLGPNAENNETLSELHHDLISSIIEYRSRIWQGPSIQIDEAHDRSLEELKARFKDFIQFLQKNSTPFSSLRYLAHMTSDQLLPALAAYYAGMIYNSNNVSIQSSVATTLLEALVMRDLCDMVGLKPIQGCDPFAHITTDGSIANIEAMWASREAKFLPFAARQAITDVQSGLQKASSIKVKTCDGRGVKLMDADHWTLWNLTRNERLGLPRRIAGITGLKEYEVWTLLARQNINTLGWQSFTQYFHQSLWPIVLMPSTAHYSWPKAGAVLGLGTMNCLKMRVNRFARINTDDLTTKLDKALNDKQPVLMVVSVYGSTTEGAVDPLKKTIEIRDQYRKKGLDFDIHVDAAWGGYFISTIRKEFKLEDARDRSKDPFLEYTREVPLSDYTIAQTKQIRFADSITIDPHKMGYVQYPAGAILYNHGDVINLTTFAASYIGSSDDPSLGLFGLEGSRPGAAAAAVYFTHACIRPDHKGYGRILSRSLYNAKQFYAELMFMEGHGKFKTACLMPYDAEVRDTVEKDILRKSLKQIMKDPVAMKIFRELGPDQNIVDYGFNPIIDGVLNKNVHIYNEFIEAVYHKLSIQGETTPQPELMLSIIFFKKTDYGDEFISNFASRLGLDVSLGVPDELNCLRSSIMNPFTSAIENHDSFWPKIMDKLGNAVSQTSDKLKR